MGVSRICKAGVQNCIVWIIMGSNLSLDLSPPKKILKYEVL